jgi:hypothetical protein
LGQEVLKGLGGKQILQSIGAQLIFIGYDALPSAQIPKTLGIVAGDILGIGAEINLPILRIQKSTGGTEENMEQEAFLSLRGIEGQGIQVG